MTEARIKWIDEAKGFGIIFVMLGHCYLDDKLDFWFTSFHMALFFSLSGYTFNGRGPYTRFLKQKIRGLLFPYVFFVVSTMLCNGLLAVTHGRSYDIREILIAYVFQIRYTLLWFITCLFIAEQCMYLLSNISSTIKVKYFWLFSSMIQFAIFYLYRKLCGVELIWNADLALLALACMSFGKWLSEVSKRGIQKQVKVTNLLILGMISVATSVYHFIRFGPIDWYSNRYGNPILFVVVAVSGVVFIMELSKEVPIPWLVLLGKNSLLYFGLHRIVIDNTFAVYNKLGITIVDGSFQSFVLGCVSVAVAIAVLTPINWAVLKYIPWCLGKPKSNR